jgi:hypothetical protein
MSNDSINDIVCDRCGESAEFADGEGGNCPECGNDLCIGCAGSWREREDYDESGDLVCDSCYDHHYSSCLKFRNRSDHWVDRYLRPLGACTGAMEAAYMYNSPREAWEKWDDAGDMLWLLGKTERIPANPSEIDNCLCDMAEHILPVYEKHCPNDDRPRKVIDRIKVLVGSDWRNHDHSNKLRALDLTLSDLRGMTREYPNEPNNVVTCIVTVIESLAECVRPENFTIEPYEIPRILLSVLKSNCASQAYADAVAALADEQRWQCGCVRKYFPCDLFKLEQEGVAMCPK